MKTSSAPMNSDPSKMEPFANNNFMGVAIGNGYLAGGGQERFLLKFETVSRPRYHQFAYLLPVLPRHDRANVSDWRRIVHERNASRQWDILLSPDCCQKHENLTEHTYWCDWYATAINDTGPCCDYQPKDPKMLCDRVVRAKQR